MVNHTVTTLINSHCLLGENPLWNGKDQCLYWTDIDAGTIHRFNDAQVFVGRMDYKTVSLGLSYDFNFSTLTPASNSRGAYELSLVYQFGEIERGRGCPVF